MLMELNDGEYKRCLEFAMESAKSQQRVEFGNKQTSERSVEDIARDTIVGKMAEVAVVKFLREYGLHLPVNYEVYPRGEWDDEDVVVNGRTIDIKATRKGHCLMVEKSKMLFRLKQDRVPNIIVACKIKDERRVELVGAISTWRMVRPDGEKILFLKKGEFIPGTRYRLKTDNYVVEFKNLCDIRKAFDYVLKDAGYDPQKQ